MLPLVAPGRLSTGEPGPTRGSGRGRGAHKRRQSGCRSCWRETGRNCEGGPPQRGRRHSGHALRCGMAAILKNAAVVPYSWAGCFTSNSPRRTPGSQRPVRVRWRQTDPLSSRRPTGTMAAGTLTRAVWHGLSPGCP